MNIKILLLALISFTVINAQSVLVIDSNADLNISVGAEICSDSLSGVLTGDGSFCGNPTDVEIKFPDNIPTEFALEQNYPNPFNPGTTIRFNIPFVKTQSDATLHTTLKVYDVLGNEVATLVDGYKSAGTYEVEFDASNLSSGLYLYKLNVGEPSKGLAQSFTSTKKMILIK